MIDIEGNGTDIRDELLPYARIKSEVIATIRKSYDDFTFTVNGILDVQTNDEIDEVMIHFNKTYDDSHIPDGGVGGKGNRDFPKNSYDSYYWITINKAHYTICIL